MSIWTLHPIIQFLCMQDFLTVKLSQRNINIKDTGLWRTKSHHSDGMTISAVQRIPFLKWAYVCGSPVTRISSTANISANHRNVPQTVDICTKRGRSHSQYVPPFTSGGGRIVEALFQANMDANTHLDIIEDAFFTGSQTISFCIMATKTGILSNIMISS